MDCRWHAVVTGGNKGIGFEICKQLASNGVFVILTARNEKLGSKALHKLKELGISGVIFHHLDVTDSDSLVTLVKFIETNFGKLDILVNNAGVSGVTVNREILNNLQLPRDREYRKPYSSHPYYFLLNHCMHFDQAGDYPELANRLINQTYKGAEECFKVNYYGTKNVSEALIPFLQLSLTPKIINLSSVYGHLRYISNEKTREELNHVERLQRERIDELLKQFLTDFREDKLETHGWPDTMAAYKISKAAINAYTRMLAKELPGFSINCVHPGLVKTDMNVVSGFLSAEEGARGPVMLALLPDQGALRGSTLIRWRLHLFELAIPAL